MDRIPRDSDRQPPSLDINISWKRLAYEHFRTIVASILFLVILGCLIFVNEIDKEVKPVLIGLLGSFTGYIIAKESRI